MFETPKKQLRKLPPFKWLRDTSRKDFSYLTQGTYFTHAVSTPLTSAMLQLERSLHVLADQPQTAEAKNCVSQALLHTQHVQKLLRTKNVTPHKLNFNLKLALQEVVTRLNDKQKHILSCHVLWDDELYVQGQVFYFQEALACLITNSLQASIKQKTTHTVIIGLPLGKKVQLYICDAGQGMSWITHRLAAFKGFTTKSNGMGQGLAFAKEVVEEYFKGTLSIKSQRGLGTVVMLQLPIK